MKSLLLSFMLTGLAISSFSQSSTVIKTKEYYLTKSKHQRTIGWAMAGGGIALAAVGVAVVNTETIDYSLGATNKNGAGVILTIVGLASALGSIPVFISSGHNKRRAAELAFDIQPIPFALGNSISYQPVLKLNIKL